MLTEYTIRVKLPNGALTEVRIVAQSQTIAEAQAQAYGQVCGCLSSRYV